MNKLALDFTKDDNVSSPVSKPLAEIINKRWVSKVSDKLKELSEKYDRHENCEKLAVPQVNPEILEKLTRYVKKQDLRLSAIQNMQVKVGAVIALSAQNLMDFRTKGANGGKLDTAAALTSQIHVIALLGHTNYELSLCQREAIKPNLNKKRFPFTKNSGNFTCSMEPYIPVAQTRPKPPRVLLLWLGNRLKIIL